MVLETLMCIAMFVGFGLSDAIFQTNFAKNTFVTNDPDLDFEWTAKLFPNMLGVNLQELKNQAKNDNSAVTDTCGATRQCIAVDTYSQINFAHAVFRPSSELSVTYIQQQYQLKWKHVMNHLETEKTTIYDAFFDYSVAYWVSDLTHYYRIWKSSNANIIFLKWRARVTDHDSADDNKSVGEAKTQTFYSMITGGDLDKYKYDGKNTLAQYELISNTFSILDDHDDGNVKDDIIILDSEQRAFINSDLINYDIMGSLDSGERLLPIGARRSVVNLDNNINFYMKILGISNRDSDRIQTGTFLDYNGNPVKYGHILLDNSNINGDNVYSASISLFERDNDASTYGEFKTSDFVRRMNLVHDNTMVSPYCGIDKWYDMHYTISLDLASNDMTNGHLTGEKVLENVINNKYRYNLHTSDNVFYLYINEPNGHGVQFTFKLDKKFQESLYVAPNEWNEDVSLCPVSCNKDQLQLAFGDFIFDKSARDGTGVDDDQSMFHAKARFVKNFQGRQNIVGISVVIISLIITIGFSCAFYRFMRSERERMKEYFDNQRPDRNKVNNNINVCVLQKPTKENNYGAIVLPEDV